MCDQTAQSAVVGFSLGNVKDEWSGIGLDVTISLAMNFPSPVVVIRLKKEYSGSCDIY